MNHEGMKFGYHAGELRNVAAELRALRELSGAAS